MRIATPRFKWRRSATLQVRRELRRAFDAARSSDHHEALTVLGESLGEAVKKKMGPEPQPFALVSTPEDADHLVSGMLRAIGKSRARLVCYWSERHAFKRDEDVATVFQEYVDPRLRDGVNTVVIANSFIASGCIVRANLEKLLLRLDPRRIIIAAPVMLDGAEKRLRSSFPRPISSRFEFVTFGVDQKRNSKIVDPAVGGMVEERLGYKASRRLPRLVNDWHRAVQQLQ